MNEMVGDRPWHLREKDDQLYQMFRMQPEKRTDYPGRADLLVGYTAVPDLWQRFHAAEVVRSGEFSICGEIFCYLKIDGINGLEGSVFKDKSQIEDTLDEALRSFNVGCVVGGGTGLRYSYVDFALTDFSMAFGIIRKVLRAGNIPNRSWILFFDSDKAQRWIGVWDDTLPPP
jgi:hypothetical protein